MLNITRENFEEKVLHSDKPVLVDFFATWCGPCKAMHPVIEELAAESDIVVGKVDIDAEPELAEQFRIMSVPTFLSFQNGKARKKLVGMQKKGDLLALARA